MPHPLPFLPPEQRQALFDYAVRLHNKLREQEHEQAAQWVLLVVIQPLCNLVAAERSANTRRKDADKV